MDKESILELEKIDCNCNSCKHMVRDFDKYKKSLDDHQKWQLDYFNIQVQKLKNRAKEWLDKGEVEKHENLLKEVDKMKFQFDRNEAMINYGNCSKLNKSVSFIPNICQIETQNCFEHRREK